MIRADVERKFRSNLGSRTPQEGTGAVLQALWALDRTDDLRSLTDKLASGRDAPTRARVPTNNNGTCRHQFYITPA